MHELPGVHLEPVLSRPGSALWNEYIDRYHYLGCPPLPGAQLRYFARWENRLLALLGFGAPAWKTAPRDRFIGWCPSERERNLQLIVNNARFLILPWVQSQNLASKLLALAARLLPQGHCHANRVGPQRPAWIPFQAAALALSHTLNASFRNRLNVSLLHK